MKKSIAILLAILCVFALVSCSKTESKGDDPTEPEKESFVEITTPYAVLKAEESFDNKVSHKETEKDPYTLTFVNKEDNTELFSLVFNGKGDVLLGTILGEKENTVIYMNVAKLDPDSENYQENLAYQEGVNDMIKGLVEDYEFVTNEAIEYEDDSTFEIKTSVVNLKYPSKWKDRVKAEVTDDGVKFSDKGTPVFDLMFKECDGNLLGTYKGTPVYIVEYEVKNDDQIAMKEDVSVILSNLMEDPDFVVKG